jgi:hypothetical protein
MGIELEICQRCAELAIHRSLCQVVADLEGIVSAEEFCDLVTKCRIPRHALGIKRFQESARIVGFKAPPQLIEHTDSIRLCKCGMRAALRLGIAIRILRMEPRGCDQQGKTKNESGSYLPSIPQLLV